MASTPQCAAGLFPRPWQRGHSTASFPLIRRAICRPRLRHPGRSRSSARGWMIFWQIFRRPTSRWTSKAPSWTPWNGARGVIAATPPRPGNLRVSQAKRSLADPAEDQIALPRLSIISPALCRRLLGAGLLRGPGKSARQPLGKGFGYETHHHTDSLLQRRRKRRKYLLARQGAFRLAGQVPLRAHFHR